MTLNSNPFVSRNNCFMCGKEGKVICDKPMKDLPSSLWIAKPYIPDWIIEKGRYVIRMCSSCRLLFQSEILSDEYLFKLYDQFDYKRHLDKTIESWDSAPFRHILSIGLLAGTISQPPSKVRVLDYGAGYGRWALIVNAFGYDVYASDLSQNRLAYMKSQGIQVIEDNFYERLKKLINFILSLPQA